MELIYGKDLRAVFVGGGTYFSCWIKIEGNKLFYRDAGKLLPFGQRWKCKLTNFGDKLDDFETLRLVDPADGVTQTIVYRFPLNWETMDKDYTHVNIEKNRYIKSLEKQRDNLFLVAKEFEHLLSVSGNSDLIKKKVKADFNFYTQDLRPGYVNNMNNDAKKKK